jgi:hypothetical protein
MMQLVLKELNTLGTILLQVESKLKPPGVPVYQLYQSVPVVPVDARRMVS